MGAEMGGHGEARLAGPDTAIFRVQGTGTVARCFRAPRILPPLILALLRNGASDSERQIGSRGSVAEKRKRKSRVGSPVKIGRIAPGRTRATARVQARVRALAVASVN